MHTIPRLQKWYGAATWLAFSLLGAFVVAHYMGATNYVQNWLGSCFKLTSAAYLAHWICRDLLGTPQEHTPTMAQVAVSNEAEIANSIDQHTRNLTIGRAMVIAAAMVSVCLAT